MNTKQRVYAALFKEKAANPSKTELSSIADIAALNKKADAAIKKGRDLEAKIDKAYDEHKSASNDLDEAKTALEEAQDYAQTTWEDFTDVRSDGDLLVKDIYNVRSQLQQAVNEARKSLSDLGLDEGDVPAIKDALQNIRIIESTEGGLEAFEDNRPLHK